MHRRSMLSPRSRALNDAGARVGAFDSFPHMRELHDSRISGRLHSAMALHWKSGRLWIEAMEPARNGDDDVEVVVKPGAKLA